MPVSSVTEHWIKQDAIIINLNHFGDPDYLQVSVLAGAVVMAFKQDVIGYNAARNYRTWPLQAANTFFETTDALNVYARLTRSEVNASALIIYDPLLRDIEGRSISYADDGSEILGEADAEYYYIYLGQISSSLDSNGNEIGREWSVDFRFGNLDTAEQNNFSGLLLEKMFKPHYDDKTNPNKLTSIEALAGLWTEQFLSAKGMNSGGGSDEPTGGATTLGGLRNVAADADRTYDVAKMLVLEAKSNLWSLKNLSELVGGLDEAELAEYLTKNNYAKKGDIPSLSGYATEQWVLGKGYATTSDLDNRIDALVNGAPAAYDTLKEIADVLAGNVNSISDILTALGNKADKATTLSGYGITDAYTIAQIDGIVNGLSGNISTLQGYFTDGVANSALRLSDNGSYTAWGQTFFMNGKPKSLSGALTDVTDITSSGTITTNKIVIGNGTIEWDDTNKGFKVTGLYSTTYLSAMGANSSGGSSSGGGLIESLWKIGDLGKTFNTNANDTFNAYAINAIHNRVSVLEGKATNVSFTQSLTSGTQIGVITIDGASKNIYAPTIPTNLSQFTNDLGLGTFAYKSNLAFADLTDKPTTLGGYGITDWSVTFGDYDVNGRYDAGYYMITNGSNAPTHANYGSLLVMPYRKASGNTMPDFGTQIFLPSGDDSSYPNDMFFRTSLGSSWNAWQRVLTDNNYTNYIYSKSTIDTKLGGYLPLSGGTITGNLIVGGILNTSSHLRLQNHHLFVRNNEYADWIVTDRDWQHEYAIIHSGNYTDYTYSKSQVDSALGGYLPLSGGTLTGNLIVGGILNTSAHLQLQKHNLFVRNNEYADWIVTDKDWQHEYAIIHSGNIGSQSVSYATSAGGADVITKTYANENINYSRYESKIRLIRCNTNADTAVSLGYPRISYVSGLSVLTDYTGWQMISYGAPSGLPNPYYRAVGDNGVWTDWRKLAFIDDNVASATKLQTARSIWGQSFDGTGNVDDVFRLISSAGSGDAFHKILAYPTSPYGLVTRLYNNGDASLQTQRESNDNECFNLILNPFGGNVGIGTTSPQYKLDVGGNFRATRLRTNNICLECVMDGSESGCSSEINNFNSLLYMQFHSSLGISMCYGGGNVGIGNANPQYKLDISGTLHASGAVTFDSTLAISGAARIDGNVAIGNGSDGNKLYVYGVVRSAAYNAIGNNNAAFVFDKPGSNYTGIGANGVADTIYFGACSTSGAWVTDYYQKWHFNGEVYAKTGVWSDGYVSAKGQNTSSDMRLKNVLNEVVLGVKDIANAPSVRFAWKNGGGVDVGSSAQYWQGLLPDAVKERDGMLEMQYANIALLSAIAIAKKVEKHEEKLARAEKHEERIVRLEKENKELRNEIMILKGGNYA